jgi:hypothetical protein
LDTRRLREPKRIKLLLREQLRLEFLLVRHMPQRVLAEAAFARVTGGFLFHVDMRKDGTHGIARQELQNRIVLHAFDQVAQPMMLQFADFDALVSVV